MAGILAVRGWRRKQTRRSARRAFPVVGRAAGGYDGGVNSNGESAGTDGPDPAWLAALSRKEAARVAAARQALPSAATAAGRDLPVVVAAWSLLDPAQASRLLEEWLARASEAGEFELVGPVVCQLAEWVAERLPDPEAFAARVLPGLARCVEREFARYDGAGMGLPTWPAAGEALFPAEFAPGRFTVELAVLLSNEAAAFGRLAAGHAEWDRAAGEAEGEKREMDNWMMEDFWDKQAFLFLRHDEGRETTPDLSPCGFFPLAWEETTAEMAESLRTRAVELAPEAWPARTWALFFALLLRTRHASVIARMRRLGLPGGASPAVAAAWTVLAAGADAARQPFLEHIPRTARWVDRHGRRIAQGLLAAGAALAVFALARGVVLRDRRNVGADADLERRARLACESGAHARAAALYAQAAKRGHSAYHRYRQAGEWMHLGQYADAEAAYRELLAQAPDTANARLNLALAVLKQGRREEALALYRAVAEAPGAEAHPELAARARLAAELVARQLALDAAAPAE